MSDGHPSPSPQWAGWDSQVGRGEGLSSSVSPPEVRVGESSVLWALAGLPLCGLAQLWPSQLVPLVDCAGAPQPEPLDWPCQLFPLSSQLTEWLPLVPQILESTRVSSAFSHPCLDSLTAVTWLQLLGSVSFPIPSSAPPHQMHTHTWSFPLECFSHVPWSVKV